ncbi:hypothetical protein FQN55_008971 [Onygenales sp. PD_40]|nr:hypothetical protein FQN55_008971 [Onygenales sp. PD_40]KAK2787020.1 hypothetical protein FQN51_003460 [Onygenales sp. PD_10]KAK2793510.1 hypothetical protein FQN52_001096 [Onygenales sp. PD_12]
MQPNPASPAHGPAAGVASDDSDYEYEYDDSATEVSHPFLAYRIIGSGATSVPRRSKLTIVWHHKTFYLNLDLTTCNGPIRAPRKRTASSSNTPFAASTPDPHQPIPFEPPHSPENPAEEQLASVESDLDHDQIQIMDLHSENPIISYRNQLFSCSWADLVGTELTFTAPEERSTLPRLRHDQAFDLISANRAKILGQKANLIFSSDTRPPSSIITRSDDPAGLPAAALSDPAHHSRPAPLTNQGRFLERLMNAKHAKGETDVVRTAFSQKRNQNFESRLQGWARTGERMAELEQLNRRVLQGDTDALAALEDIYARAEGPAASVVPAAASSSSSRGQHAESQMPMPMPMDQENVGGTVSRDSDMAGTPQVGVAASEPPATSKADE